MFSKSLFFRALAVMLLVFALIPGSTGEGAGEEAAAPIARGYVLVTSPTVSGWLPLPEEEDYVYPLRQITGEGKETVNMIHVTPDGVYMESSTCDNQNCVQEGIVTLENRTERILGNMIICLPNQVTLELYSAEELFAAASAPEGETP